MDGTFVIELGLLVVAAVAIAAAFIQHRKAGNKDIPWDKIRPILTETFLHVQALNDAKAHGYQAVEDYAVLFVRHQVEEATFLTADERKLISDDLIRSILSPRLKELFAAMEK